MPMLAPLLFALIVGAQAEPAWQKICKMFDHEFDNYDQLEDLKCGEQWGGCLQEEHSPLHSIFKRVDDKTNLTAIQQGEGCILYVEQFQDKDPSNVYRQKLYVIAPNLTMSLWGFANPKAVLGAYKDPSLLNGLAYPNAYNLKGCEVHWKWDESSKMFKGKTDPASCSLVMNKTKYTITDDNTLSDNFITIHEHWDPPIPGTNKMLPEIEYRWRQATQQYYNGFVYAANPRNMTQSKFVSNITLINDGQIKKITVGDMAWFVEVTVCHYSLNETAADHSGLEVLKLAAYQEGQKQAMAYTFVQPGTPSMGFTYRDITATNVIFQTEFKLVTGNEKLNEVMI